MRVLELTAHMKKMGRGQGRSATAAAAYRACCVIECEREGRTHDYSRKKGLEASGIAVPKNAPAWAKDRAKLWNAAEMREKNGARGPRAGQFKTDAVVSREFMFSFPAELSKGGRARVAEAVAREMAETHGIAADYSIHQPGKDGDERNFHCHMMTTTRRLNAKGLHEKAREWDDLTTGPRILKQWRAFIAKAMNDALAAEGKANLVFVEHRSFETRGSGQTATKHQGPGKTHAARNEQRRARDAWRQAQRAAQDKRHTAERVTLKTRHDFDLAASDVNERERRSIEAIRAKLRQDQAADIAPKGAARVFQIVTGRAMRGDFDREARAAQRSTDADRAIAAVKAEARAERNAFTAAQRKEVQEQAERHAAENGQFGEAVEARVRRDRLAEQQTRRDQARDRGRERDGYERDGPGQSPAPS